MQHPEQAEHCQAECKSTGSQRRARDGATRRETRVSPAEAQGAFRAISEGTESERADEIVTGERTERRLREEGAQSTVFGNTRGA